MKQTTFPNRWLPYLLLSASIVIISVFFLWPGIDTIVLSLYRLTPFGDARTFAGIDNFKRLISDSNYRNSFILTLIFVAVVVGGGLTVSLFGAVIVNQRYPGFNIYRSLLIWPFALSPTIAGLIWALMLDPAVGAVGRTLRNVMGFELNWRTQSWTALFLLAVAAAWKMVGYNVVFFLAGLQSVEPELLEAAQLDGASKWTRFWRITFPLLSPMTFFLIVMNSLYAFFDVFGLIDVTTQGGPGRSTDLLIHKLYRDGFVGLDTGFASAQSIVLLALVSGIMLIQFTLASRRVYYQ